MTVVPMTVVPIVPMPAMVPAHLSRQLAGLFLSRHRAGIDQRQRHGTLTRYRDNEQSRNSEKAQNPFRVHLYLPFRLRTAAELTSGLGLQTALIKHPGDIVVFDPDQ